VVISWGIFSGVGGTKDFEAVEELSFILRSHPVVRKKINKRQVIEMRIFIMIELNRLVSLGRIKNMTKK
jgi:hypothetical protein